MNPRKAAAAALALAAMVAAGCARNDESRRADASARSAGPASAEGSPKVVTSADGVRIQYRVYGQGEPAVVLVHGWSCDSGYWSAQLDELRARYTVTTVDLAGHGASGTNRTDWSVGNYGEDVASVVRQLPNHQVILVGHSMGGPVALQAAVRIGDRVAGIIGVDTFKTIGLPPPSDARIDKQLEPFRADFVAETRRFVSGTFFTSGADPQFVQKVAHDMSLARPEVAIPSISSLLSMDFESVLPQIRVPIIAINSDLSPTDEPRIRKAVPAFRAIVVPDAGHFLMMERPQDFNAILVREIELLARESAGRHTVSRTGS